VVTLAQERVPGAQDRLPVSVIRVVSMTAAGIVYPVRTPSDGRREPYEGMKKPRFAGLFPMRPRRLELPRTIRSTRPSTLRVYQFRHRRVGGQYRDARAGRQAGARVLRGFGGWRRRALPRRLFGADRCSLIRLPSIGFAGSLLVSVRQGRYVYEHMFDGGLAG
jgi:hypothetical protein